MSLHRPLLRAAVVLSCTVLGSQPALADRIPETEAKGFGTAYSLLDVALMTASGTRRGAGDVDYTRRGAQLEYRVGGYFEENYFKTLIGLEGNFALGYQGENAFGTLAPPPPVAPIPGAPATPTSGPGPSPYVDTDKSAYYVRADGLFTYGLVRWTKGMSGRIVLGAGGGFETGPRWRGGEGGEGYPLLLARLQLWPREDVGVHVTAATTVGSYRLEGLVNLGQWTLGVRARFLNPAREDKTEERQLELLGGILF